MTDLFASDPWGDELTPEEPTELETTPAPVIPLSKKETAISDNASDKVVVTLKGGAGYDAPWIVFHGSTPVEVDQTIRDAFAASLHDTVKKAAELFSPKAGGGFKTPQASAVAPVASTPPPGMALPQSCEHGAYVFKEGVSAKGPWKAFMCPASSRTCPPKWLPKG